MNVKAFINWLQTQDQEAEVEILVRIEGAGYAGDCFKREPFDLNKHQEYTDFRGNRFMKESDSSFNKRFLFIGSDE